MKIQGRVGGMHFYFSLPKAYDVEARDREEKKRKQRDGEEVSAILHFY